MADLRDVMNALAAICANTLYPNGTSNPLSPVNGAVTQIKTGWPLSRELDSSLTAGTVTVTLFAVGNSKNTTRFLPQWQNVGTVTAGTAGAPGSQPTANDIRRVSREIQITTWTLEPPGWHETGACGRGWRRWLRSGRCSGRFCQMLSDYGWIRILTGPRGGRVPLGKS